MNKEDFEKRLRRGYLWIAIFSSIISALPLMFISLFENHLQLFTYIWMIITLIGVYVSPKIVWFLIKNKVIK